MIHPNGVAVDYIWDKLVGAMFSDEAVRTMFEVSAPRLGEWQADMRGVIICSTSRSRLTELSALVEVGGAPVSLRQKMRKRPTGGAFFLHHKYEHRSRLSARLPWP